MDRVLAVEALRSVVEEPNYFQIWIGPDRRFVVYPCSGGTQLNVAGIHNSSESASDTDASSDGDSWSRQASKDTMKKVFATFEPRVQALMDLAEPESLKAWSLLDMEMLPTFIHGHVVLLGDAAHPFLPRKLNLIHPARTQLTVCFCGRPSPRRRAGDRRCGISGSVASPGHPAQ